MNKSFFLLFLCFPLLLIGQADSLNNEADQGAWEFDLSPSAWIAGSGLDIRIIDKAGTQKESFSEVFNQLGIGGHLHLEAQHEDWLVFSSVSFISLEKTEDLTIVGAKTRLETDQMYTELAGGKNLINWSDWLLLDGFVGVRSMEIRNRVRSDVAPASTKNLSIIDPFLGLRLRTVSEKSFKSMRLDLGGFGLGSETAWKANILAGHRFTEIISAHIGLQAQGFYYSENSYTLNLNATGLLIGLNFRL